MLRLPDTICVPKNQEMNKLFLDAVKGGDNGFQ